MSFPFQRSMLTAAILLAHTGFSLAAPTTPGNPSAPAAHIEFGAAHVHIDQVRSNSRPMPRTPQALPPSTEQIKYNLPASTKQRNDLLPVKRQQSASLTNEQPASAQASAQANPQASNPDCRDMNKLANLTGTALADYLVNLPDYECHYGLFSLTAEQARKAYSPANFEAVAKRFASEAQTYNGSDIKLVNLLIYLRAGYFLASNKVLAAPADNLRNILRPAISSLAGSPRLFTENSAGSSSANETMLLITNMNDEAFYLPTMKSIVQRYTNSASNPKAVEALRGRSAGAGFTGVLTVLFYAHYRPEAKSTLQSDLSYPQALYNFVNANRSALLATSTQYQLTDAEREALRFLQYANQKPFVKTMAKNLLASSSMTGNDSAIWLEAASSVSAYDKANCAEYGTCNFETKLADAVLKTTHTCSPSLRIRAQDMSTAQLQESCKALAAQESYFHQMLQTGNKPVANDLNTALELVVFDDYANYDKYASIIYGIDTNNGGMYLEGNPAKTGNQARFIAHEASWLRPTFKVWNLEHEYVHYLDGRFNMAGDFGVSTSKPTGWWIEGIAEYLSLRHDNQKSIDEAKKGSYKLSTIFGNTYSMSDYTARAYRWGYMASRFMNERHRSDINTIMSKFRQGDYEGYQRHIDSIGNRYDAEFAAWAQTASTAGQPPLPTPTPSPTLPNCPRSDRLDKNCSLKNFANNYRSYSAILLPTGAKNLRISTSGGSGDVDLYVALDHYPTPTSGDPSSATAGSNQESVTIANPVARRWYYVTMDAKKPFAGVTLSATYE